MAGKKTKVYAVKAGRKPGIYYSWKECEEQVKGFGGASFKAFEDENEARAFIEGEEHSKLGDEDVLERELRLTKEYSMEEDTIVAYPDGSYKDETGQYSYGLVIVDNNKIVYQDYAIGENEDAASMRNVAGEITGSEVAVEYAKKTGAKRVVIFHDYIGIAAWAKNEWQAKNEHTKRYKKYMKEEQKNVKIDFVKVAAHEGNPFNEMADLLAKKALGIEKK